MKIRQRVSPMGLSVYSGENSLVYSKSVDKTVLQPPHLSFRLFVACVPIG